MAQDKARKAATRQRMAATGEPYSVARHAVEREHEGAAAEVPVSAGRGAPPRDDRWYASEAEQAGMTVAEFRMWHLADLADKARKRAEEAVSMAYEAARLAQEAADMTRGWADKQEQERAQRRAKQAQDAAEEADRQAGEARWQLVDAAAAAEAAAADLAAHTGGSPDTRPHGGYRDLDHDGADPGRSHQSRGPADRLQDQLGEVLSRFGHLMSRAMQATNPAHAEPKDTDSG